MTKSYIEQQLPSQEWSPSPLNPGGHLQPFVWSSCINRKMENQKQFKFYRSILLLSFSTPTSQMKGASEA